MKKLVKSKKRVYSKYSREYISEALKYWRGKLRALDEADDTDGSGDGGSGDTVDDDASAGDIGLPSEDSAETKAKSTPVGVWNIGKRMVRIHKSAVKGVRSGLGKLINKAKFADPEAVDITNSYIDNGEDWNPKDGEPMIVTISVDVDKTKVKGFRKFLAIIKEDDSIEQIDETSIWKAMFGAAKEAGDQKIKEANVELKKRIGILGMQEYFKRFLGVALAKKINLKNVFFGAEEEGDGAQLTFTSAVEVED